MERFICKNEKRMKKKITDLKSNMERFISTRVLMKGGFNYVFKIQYGEIYIFA